MFLAVGVPAIVDHSVVVVVVGPASAVGFVVVGPASAVWICSH